MSNRIRQHFRDSKDENRFDTLIDGHILDRVRVVTGEPSLTWEDMLKSAFVTVDTYLDTKNYRKIWIRVGDKKVLHIEIDFKRNLLNVQEI